jgi:hypothetical protein
MKYNEAVDVAKIKTQIESNRPSSPAVIFNEKPKKVRKIPVRNEAGDIIAVDEVEVNE